MNNLHKPHKDSPAIIAGFAPIVYGAFPDTRPGSSPMPSLAPKHVITDSDGSLLSAYVKSSRTPRTKTPLSTAVHTTSSRLAQPLMHEIGIKPRLSEDDLALLAIIRFLEQGREVSMIFVFGIGIVATEEVLRSIDHSEKYDLERIPSTHPTGSIACYPIRNWINLLPGMLLNGRHVEVTVEFDGYEINGHREQLTVV